MSKFSVITVLAILIAGCIEHEPIPTTSKKITPISKDTLAVSEKLAGYTIYEGVIPCNNCLGIYQKLLLKGDKKGVFRLTETYNKSGEELDPTPAIMKGKKGDNEFDELEAIINDFNTRFGIDNWTGTTGANVSGTTDLAPLDEQADMINELYPNSKKVGILYCSGEPNSKYQATTITDYLKKLGKTVKEFTFADSNDVASVTKTACGESDVLYVPTDNTAANCAKTVNNVALKEKTPIIAGEEGICSGCGVATLSISYYDLGYATGEMAYDVLVNGKDISKMEVKSAPKFTKEYNVEICKALGLDVPSDYKAIGEDK